MRVFTFEENVGIAGGQDHRSLYFTGLINKHCNSDPNLIYLDPHIVQDACTTPNLNDEQLDTFACPEVRVLSLSKISTSVAIGFYIRNIHEYSSFKPRIQALAKMQNSIFSVYEQSEKPEHNNSQKSKYQMPQMVHLNDEDEDGFEMI